MKDIRQAEFLYNKEQHIHKVIVDFVDGEKVAYTTAEEIAAVSEQLKEQQQRK